MSRNAEQPPSWREVVHAKKVELGLDTPQTETAKSVNTFSSIDELIQHKLDAGLRGGNTPPAEMLAEQPDGNPDYVPPENLKELFDRYLAGERDFRRMQLEGADLRGMTFTGVLFSLGSFAHCNLAGANFTNCKFEFTSFRAADLRGARFNRCNLSNADFREADLNLSSLVASSLQQADFSDATLWGAALEGAQIEGAAFDRADLRAVWGAEFSNNTVSGTRFSRDARDRWSVLRRNYTGSRLLFHLAFLSFFITPYAVRAAFWTGIGTLQEISQLPARLSQAVPLRETTVLSLILGLDRGPLSVILTFLLIGYNACRSVLTWKIGPLREEETRSHILPLLSEYKRLYIAHLAVRVLFVLALAMFTLHAWEWLTQPVWLPAR